MTGAPRLYSPCRDFSGDVAEFLKGIRYLDAEGSAHALDPVADSGLEIRLDIMTDDEDDPAKACGDRVVDRIVNDDMPTVVNRLKLFDTAAKTRTDTCGENNQCLLRNNNSFFYIAPFPVSVIMTVLKRIFQSRAILQFVIYSVSSRTISSKSVISLRPLTCHIPVIPGLIAIRAR